MHSFRIRTIGNRLNAPFLSIIVSIVIFGCSTSKESSQQGLLPIREQGSFAVGGKVINKPGTFNPKNPTPDGQTFHGDHATFFYQIPDKARKLPLVFWHGIGQFSKTWETTPDGREGFQTHIPQKTFRGVPNRSATPGKCRSQHGHRHH